MKKRSQTLFSIFERLRLVAHHVTLPVLRIGLLVLAVILGVLAYTRSERSWDVGLYALVLLVLFLAFWGVERAVGKEQVYDDVLVRLWKVARSRPRGMGFALAIMLNTGALVVIQGNPLSGWGVALWLSSLGVLIVSAALGSHSRLAWPFGSPSWQGIRQRLGGRTLLLELLAVTVITGAAFALRAVSLDRYPPMMHGDEGEWGVVALDILEGTRPVSPFGIGWNGNPAMFNFWQAASMAVFGKDEVGLRMLSAFAGTLSVPALYLLVRLPFGRLAALTAASLLAISHLHIHVSRIALANIQSSFLTIVVLMLIALARMKRSSVLYALAGLATTYSMYFYFGSRVIPLLAAILLVFLLVERKASLNDIFLFGVAAWLAFAPLALTYMQNPSDFAGRMEGVYLFTPQNLRHMLGASRSTDPVALLRFQIERNLLFFVHYGDASPFYLGDIPAFDPITSTLFWLGLGVALPRARRFPEFMLLVWWGAVLILGGILTIDPPNASRLIMGVPAVFAFGGLFVARARELVSGVLRLRVDSLLIPVLIVVIGISLKMNYDTYFVEYARKAPSVGTLAMAREMKRHQADYRSYLLGAPWLYANYGVMRFVARDAERADILRVEDARDLSLSEKGALFIIVPGRLKELEALRDWYPNGTYNEMRDGLGRLQYVTYQVPRLR